MGKIEFDHTGAGSGITLSSDGTDLLLNGTAVGGALELYAENPGTFIVPTATGENGIAIGSNTVAGTTFSHRNSVAIGNSTTSSQRIRAENTHAVAIGTSYYGPVNAGGDGSLAIGTGLTSASASGSVAFGAYAQAAAAQAMALGESYAAGADSFAAAIANNTSSYGATGSNSVAIGATAKATATRSICLSGLDNIASGTYSMVAGGAYNSSTGTYSFSAGQSNVAAGGYSTITGGRGNETKSSADYSVASGYNSVASVQGQIAHSAGRFSLDGDAQTGTFVLRSDTTDATPEALTSNNSTAGTTNQVILPNNSAFAFHGTIVARQQASAGTACAAWKIEGLIRREGSAGTTVLVNSATTVLDNTPGWGMTLSADTTNGGLKIEVTGAAATNIRWVATVNTSEVTY
jgi:hypothetical protein